MRTNLLHTLKLDRRKEVIEQLSKASSPSFDFFVMMILSTIIATLGLMVDSPAVVIGAMLVAPLMSPILGISIASVSGEQEVFRRASGALGRGILLGVALSAGLSWLVQELPFDLLTTLPNEILARTRPTPIDLAIALAGGAAAAYALAQPHLSAALPGVAIATALVPPLCTVGIGISLRNAPVAMGALLLFVTNLVTIAFAGIAVFAALGFRPISRNPEENNIRKNITISAVLVLLVTVPLVLLSLNFVQQARAEKKQNAFEKQVRTAVQGEIDKIANAQLVDIHIREEESLHLLVTIRTARQLAYREVVDLQDAVAAKLEQPLALELIDVPMIRLDPKIPPTPTLTPTPGPSETPTPTVTRTNTPAPPTATATITALATTALPTATFTPTPAAAYIDARGGASVYLRDRPGGAVLGSLPSGATVLLLPGREAVNGSEWIEVQDLLGRSGWVQDRYVISQP